MSLDTADLPSDPDALRAFALACQAELRAAKAAVRLTRLEIEKLKSKRCVCPTGVTVDGSVCAAAALVFLA
ncbi:hypothetical protein UCD39_25870 [Nitrospirillum sp. BR 11752]|uniref:hypothetical protein n=1 Tax=Nitrospirillum sp. BR 11752 TaxID=3104293 RepID=UPI002EC92F10|nr:hypothetical protein [Nitrospirillum sp. BR 11752]